MEFFILISFIIGTFCEPSYSSELIETTILDVGTAYIVAAIIYAGLYALRAAGLYTMARKRNMNRLLWCAFVPFASTYLTGKLAGDLSLGNAKIKCIGIVAMVAEIVFCLCLAAYYGLLSHIFLNGLYQPGSAYGYELATGEQTILYYSWTYAGISNAMAVNSFLEVMSYVSIVVEILFLIALCFLCIGFFRRYAPLSFFWMVVLCVLFPIFLSPLTFAYRNRAAVDYDAYMRARYEQAARQRQAWQDRQNNRNYGNPFGPSRGDPSSPDDSDRPVDPFGEFSGNDPFSDLNNKKDDNDKTS